MSKKIAIITDSTAGLPEAMTKAHGIYISHLMILFGNDSYQEFKTITTEKFIELSAAQSELPTTSQLSPGLTVEMYEKVLKDGYDEIIHITLSSGLSGSYQAAVSAAQMVETHKVHVFDSKTTSFPQGGLAIEATKLVKAGKNAEEIIQKLHEIRSTSGAFATVKTLENLKKGGRLSNASAVIGGMLQIKPVITMSDAGTLDAISKVRTFNKAIQFLIDAAKDANLDESFEIAVMHVQNLEDVTALKDAIAKIYPKLKIHVIEISLVIAVHVGEGALGVSWLKVNK